MQGLFIAVIPEAKQVRILEIFLQGLEKCDINIKLAIYGTSETSKEG